MNNFTHLRLADGQRVDARLVDARNMTCPMPLLKLKQALNQMVSGGIVKLIATDPVSKKDIVAFANLVGHKISVEQDVNDIIFIVTKT